MQVRSFRPKSKCSRRIPHPFEQTQMHSEKQTSRKAIQTFSLPYPTLSFSHVEFDALCHMPHLF